jgi:DNA polymerase-3 subunit epsilon
VLENGEIIDQLVSLVNPQSNIDPYVTRLTGITDKMVRTAPKFYELAKRIVQITEDCTFVAHNISFDYRVFQQEFESLGFDYHRATLDTIPYAERIFPQWENYGLKTVSEKLALVNSARHRAEGDARLTVELLKILLDKDRGQILDAVHVPKEKSVGKNPFKDQVRDLQNKVGIYYIFNQEGEVIYIGSSKDLQNSINRHFVADNKVALALQNEASRLEVEHLGNEAIAEILYHKTVEEHRPIYNAVKKKKLLNFGVFTEPKKSVTVDFVQVFPVRHKQPQFYFEGPKSLYPWLQRLMMEVGLNPKTFLLDKDREHYEKYTKKMNWSTKETSVDLSTMRSHMLPKEAVLIGPGRKGQEQSAILVENGRVLG